MTKELTAELDQKTKIWNQWLTLLHKQEERSKRRESLLLAKIRSSIPDYQHLDSLSITELHVISEIGSNARVNVTTIAQKIGVTKSAISKITVKLLKKGLLERYQLEDNQKEVFFRLTKVGELVNSIHDSFHAKLENDMIRFLDRYSKEELAFVSRFIGEATEQLQKNWAGD
ncbi:MarR family transcriptional regulator [Brevibacillus parabrevis]|uniref:MarR family transcriptional regulator n=1 Tax=Brevibacillus parabrevis TaxID=54914 RepID=UPI0026D8863F|nr:MarR family transcriptional regulator [Brevibacillus parabrevis]MED1721529.1 MarR family transcriptional regulator [Brevibacillus parabrevis]